jgi:hypothetical protein
MFTSYTCLLGFTAHQRIFRDWRRKATSFRLRRMSPNEFNQTLSRPGFLLSFYEDELSPFFLLCLNILCWKHVIVPLVIDWWCSYCNGRCRGVVCRPWGNGSHLGSRGTRPARRGKRQAVGIGQWRRIDITGCLKRRETGSSQHQATFMHRVSVIVHRVVITTPTTITGIVFYCIICFRKINHLVEKTICIHPLVYGKLCWAHLCWQKFSSVSILARAEYNLHQTYSILTSFACFPL